jgi:CzcA family heavy metal efflux pump
VDRAVPEYRFRPVIRRVVGWSLKFRLLVLVAAAGVVFLGVSQLRDMPVNALPEFSPTYVELQTEALGLSPEEVEQLITVPLEGDLLNGVPGLETIRSQSAAGLSSIVMVFKRGTDLLQARQLVAERLTLARALPALSLSKPPTMLQPLSSSSRVMMIGLHSTRLSLVDMSLLARWTIRPRLLGIRGVSNVAIWGQREHQLQVQVDPARLRRNGVSLAQVLRTSGNAQLVSPLSFLEASTPGASGFLDAPNQRLQIRHVLPIGTPQGLAQVPVDGVPGGRLRLGDVATVKEDHQPLIGDAVVDGGSGLLLAVEKLPGANTRQVTTDVENALKELRPGLAGVEVDSSVFRPASFVDSAVHNLALVILIAAILLVLAFLAFLFEWRAALVALFSIPVSLLAAVLVLYWRGESMNALTLAGLLVAIGVVVDDAVVGVERGRARLRRRGAEAVDNGDETSSALRDGWVETYAPLTYATWIVLVAILPIFFVGGMYGLLYRPLVLSYVLAVLASLVVALTVTPALAAFLLRSMPSDQIKDGPLTRGLHVFYARLMHPLVRRPLPLFVALGVIVLTAAVALPQFKHSLLPTFRERNLVVRLDGAPGTSLPEMSRMAARVSHELRAVPGVGDVAADVGRAALADQIVSVNSSRLWLRIDKNADYDKTLQAARRIVGGYPGIRGSVVTYSGQRVKEVEDLYTAKGADITPRGAAADKTVVVRLYGKEFDVMQKKADEVRAAVAAVAGVTRARIESQVKVPTVEVKIDLAAAERYGLKPGDIRRDAALIMSGLVVGSLFEEQKVFDVVVMGAPQTRRSLTDIRNLPITTPEGGHITLGKVAFVTIKPLPAMVEREAVSRRIDVAATIGGRGRGAVVADIKRQLDQITLPREYRTVVLGDTSNWAAAAGRVAGFAIAAMIGIFLLLQAAFGSWRLAALAFVVLPLTLSGGVVAAIIDSRTLSVGALFGFFAVFAVAARQVILLVSRYRTLGALEQEPPSIAIVLRGSQERLVPIVLTAVAIALVMLPLVVLGSVAGQEIAHPLAVVMLGGLVSTTLVSLFVVPVLYLHLAPKAVPEQHDPQSERLEQLDPAGAQAALGSKEDAPR